MDTAFGMAVVAIAGVYLLYRLSQQFAMPRSNTWSGVAERRGAVGRTAGSFQTVSVVPGEQACAAAQQFSGTRFLASEAPALPMPGCDCSNCGCVYVHHGDRRSGTPERRMNRSPRDMFGGGGRGDRRQVTGRRRSDWAPLGDSR